MANSSQEFRGKYISFDDLDMIAMIQLAMDECLSNLENDKAIEIVAGWGRQMESAGPGSIDLMLEEYLQSAEDKNAFFMILESVRNKTKAFGDFIPASALSRPVAMGVTFQDFPAREILSLLDKLESFVR